ncbi:ATP synthase F1 subunit delta [Balneolaceae bacterium YR4-1]|uniref:ATP synthase subunit delta n=1 Tax=Halalkalibaculum roseum TaxID=2709311 RepID=A0A6M1SX51_9BACT|nr:ATP synthase F1 subunit delta [Halalkalibaculum roseum]NGP76798.1 ATP synthase F1 subunit delta [Halalkalibaculum roseum]
MFITKAARRYATALLEIGKELDQVEEILDDIKLIDNTIEGSKELTMFISSPIIKYDDKKAALDEIFTSRVSEVTGKFLTLLARKGRANLLHQIAKAFVDKYNDYAGIIKIEVLSAKELNDDQVQSLQKALEKRTNKKVDMSLSQDASLKGGIAVRIDDTVIDGSVKHKLVELEQKLLSTAIE